MKTFWKEKGFTLVLARFSVNMVKDLMDLNLTKLFHANNKVADQQ